MTGGGALLRGIDKLLARETNLPVSLTEDPISTTVLGTGTILEELDVLRELTLGERCGI
jgi:rod shape-determining protein MreB